MILTKYLPGHTAFYFMSDKSADSRSHHALRQRQVLPPPWKKREPDTCLFVQNVFVNSDSLLNCINSAEKQDLAKQNRF